MNDLELARRIEAGDRQAAEDFVREHHPAVLRLATRLSGRREDGEDIAQDTFVLARQRIHTYQGRSSLRTWIHSIALNQYRQWRRGRRTLPLIDQDLAALDSEIESVEIGQILIRALAKLPAGQREAFVLFEIEQLSMAEVAQVLKIPLGTAKARVSYARQNLRTQLEASKPVIKDELKPTTPYR